MATQPVLAHDRCFLFIDWMLISKFRSTLANRVKFWIKDGVVLEIPTAFWVLRVWHVFRIWKSDTGETTVPLLLPPARGQQCPPWELLKKRISGLSQSVCAAKKDSNTTLSRAPKWVGVKVGLKLLSSRAPRADLSYEWKDLGVWSRGRLRGWVGRGGGGLGEGTIRDKTG